MHNRFFICCFVAIISLSCGSGTFENNEETWYKVFGEDPPDKIEVIQTRFWKSAHWTYEFELYAEFKTSDEFLNSYFIDRFNFEPTAEPKLDLNFEDEKPLWFVTKNMIEYSIYESPLNNMIIFKDNTSKSIYLYALQV